MLDPKVPVTCPKCGHQFQQAISRLKNNAQLVCPACRAPGRVAGGSDKVVAALDQLSRSLRKAGFKKR